jgi:hypothetical protein
VPKWNAYAREAGVRHSLRSENRRRSSRRPSGDQSVTAEARVSRRRCDPSAFAVRAQPPAVKTKRRPFGLQSPKQPRAILRRRRGGTPMKISFSVNAARYPPRGDHARPSAALRIDPATEWRPVRTSTTTTLAPPTAIWRPLDDHAELRSRKRPPKPSSSVPRKVSYWGHAAAGRWSPRPGAGRSSASPAAAARQSARTTRPRPTTR